MYHIAFTGHRPDKLGGYDWHSARNQQIGFAFKEAILAEMRASHETDFTFYFGGALGADQMAFELVTFIQQRHPEWNITKVLCVPFKQQASMWAESSKELYNSQLQRANKVVYVDREPAYQLRGVWEDIYSPAKMQKRNQYMVDHCDVLIALYNGDPKGGTANCVHYAEQVGKRIVMVSPNEV